MILAELHEVIAALENDLVVPAFQPIVELKTGVLKGFEVLARWQHPEHGPTLPSNFIQLAEQNGLIGALTRQVFLKAFQALPLLPGELTLSVNLSPLQLHYASLPQQIHDLAHESGFPLNRLIAEVTETALLKNLSRIQSVARELKEMGCRLALDDFGTGFSSLHHLQALPFDELKIDRSFVSGMTRNRQSRKIVAAIIGLGASLSLPTVAEGVETDEEAQMLLWLGCELVQGWKYGRPEPVERISGFTAASPQPVPSVLTSPGEDWATESLQALPSLRMAQLQAIYDGAPVGLCFLDRNLNYVSLNKRLAEMNGLPVQEHLGRTPRDLFPQWFPVFEPYLLRALAGEPTSGVKLERASEHPERPSQWVFNSYQPAWDEANEVIGVSISVLDITKNTELHDAVAGVLYREASQVNPEVPWIMDAEGNNLHVSSRWVQVAPLGKDRTRNLLWLEAVHQDDLEPTIKAMEQALSTGQPIDIEYRISDMNDGWRWMRSRGSPRFGPAGEIVRWCGSVEDITDRKLQEEMTEANDLAHEHSDRNTVNAGLAVAGRNGHCHRKPCVPCPPAYLRISTTPGSKGVVYRRSETIVQRLCLKLNLRSYHVVVWRAVWKKGRPYDLS